MKCPHCDEKAVFEGAPITLRPVIENWQLDDGAWQIKTIKLTCMSCGKECMADMRSKYLKKVEKPKPIFSKKTQAIIEQAKTKKTSRVPDAVIEFLQGQNYENLFWSMTGKELLRAILSQID